MVRITRDGIDAGAAPPEPAESVARTSPPESSDTDGAHSPLVPRTSNAKSDTEDEQPVPSSSAAPEEVPAVHSKSIEDIKPKRSGKSRKAGRDKDKSKRSRKRDQSTERSVESGGSDAAADEDQPRQEEVDDQAHASKLALAVQQDRNDFLAAVSDNYNGTYGVTYTPMFDGEYSMQVTLLGIHILGSPFKITVDPDLRDKTKNLTQQLEDEQRKLQEENQRALKEQEARATMEDEVKRLIGELSDLKEELGASKATIESKDAEISRLQTEVAELRAQLRARSTAPSKDPSTEDLANADADDAPAPAALTRAKSGRSKRHRKHDSDDTADSSAPNTPRADPASNGHDKENAKESKELKKKLRLSVGTIQPSVVSTEESSGKTPHSEGKPETKAETKAETRAEAKQRRRSKGPADAAAIQAALQQQEETDKGDKKISRSNSAPLNARVERSDRSSVTLQPSSSTTNASGNDSDSGANSGQGEIESRSISYKFSLAFWKLFDKRDSKEPKTKEQPKSARSGKSKKEDNSDDSGEEKAKDKKSKHKAK